MIILALVAFYIYKQNQDSIAKGASKAVDSKWMKWGSALLGMLMLSGEGPFKGKKDEQTYKMVGAVLLLWAYHQYCQDAEEEE